MDVIIRKSPEARFSGPPVRRLLSWYGGHRRALPWRRTRNPYRIWVSEVMLQQTQVATVIPFYRRFLRRFPTLSSLAKAPRERVLAAWSGLGYYRRADRLHEAAREVMRRHRGRLPSDPQLLRRLPGVGRYTAGAVASIAFGVPEPALDGNALRVLSRFLARRGNPEISGNRKPLEATARRMMRSGPAGEITQALMELGALVCTPAAPDCPRCPLRAGCRARREGLQSNIPETGRGRASVDLDAAVAVIRRDGRYLLVRRRAGDLMAGLWEFPGGVLKPGEDAAAGLVRIGKERLGIRLQPGKRIARLRQTITYRRVRLDAYAATLSEPLPRSHPRNEATRWVAGDRVRDLPHGSATRKILDRLPPGRPKPRRAAPGRGID